MDDLIEFTLGAISKGQQFTPEIKTSSNFKNWISIEDEKRCIDCEENHGKINPIEEKPKPKPPLHFFCRCVIKKMMAITAGTATINGTDGADWKLMFEGILPEYYVSLQEALDANWDYGKWPSNFVPGKMITIGNYQNRDEHLPSAPNRQWYEADINYTSGKRNKQRVLWSDDGLFFVTYDHYETFYEIIGGEQMKTIVLDLTGCKSLWDIHERIRKAFDFPEWYGKNWSAFWDLLWSECDANRVIIKGEQTIPKEYKKHLEIMHSCLDDLIGLRKKYEKYVNAPFTYTIEN